MSAITFYLSFRLIGSVLLLGGSAASVAQQIPGKPPAVGMDHSHIPVAVPEDSPAPALSLKLHKDALSGFNLEILTERYSLVPPPRVELSMTALMVLSMDSNTGFVEGHAHLYVNGEKVQRVYGHELHLPAALFRPGVNQITVTINNHGHMYWTVDARQVLATLFVDPSAKPVVVYCFESFPTETQDGCLEAAGR